MVWLSADCDTPSFAAAFVKLRSCPTPGKPGDRSDLRDAFMKPDHQSMLIIGSNHNGGAR
jgi:hypothetical protein